MNAVEYIEGLGTAAARAEAADRFWQWAAWDVDSVWALEAEIELARVMLLGVLAEIELGSDEYTAEDVENYRAAAA